MLESPQPLALMETEAILPATISSIDNLSCEIRSRLFIICLNFKAFFTLFMFFLLAVM